MKKNTVTRKKKDTYFEFVSHLEPVALGLRSSRTDLDRSAFARMRRRKNAEAKEVKAEFALECVEKCYFDACARFSLRILDRKAHVTPLTIECTFETHIHGKEPINRKFAEQFTNSGLRFLVWPYFREFVNAMAGKMSLTSVFLPFVEKA